jgi:hypothetical protein
MPVTLEPTPLLSTDSLPGAAPACSNAKPQVCHANHPQFARHNVLFETAKSVLGAGLTWGGGALAVMQIYASARLKQPLFKPSSQTLKIAAGWGALNAFMQGVQANGETRIDNCRIDALNRHPGDDSAQIQILNAGRDHAAGPVEKIAFNASLASVALCLVPRELQNTQLFRLGQRAGFGAFATAVVLFTGRNLVAPHKEKNELNQLDRLLDREQGASAVAPGIGG